MTLAITSTGRAAMLDGVLVAIGGGYIDLFAGVRPAPGVAVSDPIQVRIPLAQIAGSTDNGVLTLLAADGARLASQQLTWGRILTNSGQVLFDFAVSEAGGGGDMIVSSASGSVGAIVQLTAGVIGF